MNCLEQSIGRGVIPEGLRYVREEIDVPGAENEAAAKLKRMPPMPMLPVSRGSGPVFGEEIVATKDVKQGCGFQSGRAVGRSLLINQQGEANTGVLSETPGVTGVTQPHRRQTGAGRPKPFFAFAQLRDVLPAEDSPIVPEKDHHFRMIGPERAQPNRVSIHVRQHNRCEGRRDRARLIHNPGLARC